MADTLVRRRRGDTLRRSRETPALTASAQIMVPNRMLRRTNYDWQGELWDFYRSLDAFRFAMLWHSQTMSRVRLTAAVAIPGGDEPTPLTDGPAAELMKQFFGGPGGQSQYMRSMDIQLQVPGEGYVFGEPDQDEPGELCWHVKSTAEVDMIGGKAMIDGKMTSVDLWRIEVDEGVWRTLPYETICFKQWYPDEEKSWRPDSPARAALNVMRVLRMLHNRVIAMSVSRLASNGILLYPQEVTFPPKPGFEQELDPFTAEWLDIAGKVIDNPGSALAAIPMPLKVPQQYIKDFVHMDFANTYDERLAALIDLYYDKLSIAMNMPKEVVTGMGDTSHWTSWQLDEQGVTVHIAPGAEMMTQGITKGYLHPALKSVGEPTRTADGEIIVWYDTSELVIPPDRSAAADAAIDRVEISPAAYRREKGFSEADKPTNEEVRRTLLINMALHDPTNSPAAIEELTGSPVAGATTGPGGVNAGSPASQPTPAAGPPDQNPSTPRAAPPAPASPSE
jgi:hypothetical protein